MSKELLGSLELNRIYQMDCLEGMKLIPDKSIDMILCDLPYGTTGNQWDSIIPLNKLWEQYNRIIKGNGSILLFGSQPFTTDLISSNREKFRYEIIWQKSIGYNPLLCKKQPLKVHENILVFYKDLSEVKHSTDNYKELRDYFKSIFEIIGLTKKGIMERVGQSADHCFRFNSSQWSMPTKTTYEKIGDEFKLNLIPYEQLKEKYEKEGEELNKFTYNPQMRKGKIRDKKPMMYGDKKDSNWRGAMRSIAGIENVNDEYYPRSVVYFSNANQKEKIHPTQKPVDLCEWLVKTYSNEGDIIFDNCMGSGTTAIASLNTNRKFIGFETDSTYIELANQRIEYTYSELYDNSILHIDNKIK